MTERYKIKLVQNSDGMKLKKIMKLADLLYDSDFKIETEDYSLANLLQSELIKDYRTISVFSEAEIEGAKTTFEDMLSDEESNLESLEDTYDDTPKGLKLKQKEEDRILQNINKYVRILGYLKDM
uniref:Uncharacterized protein n=1 Tax=viral metagenome TaxID=1070528 RepID=A0A6C0AER0_9ZZZZ